MMPKVSEPGLSPNVPDSEAESSVVDFLNIESDSGDWGHGLIEFHLVENGGFSCTIESKHKYFGFHVWEGVKDLID